MNDKELEMIEILKDLRQNHHVVGLKAEFEDEGTLLEDGLRLKEMGLCADIDLTVKIGGCGAVRDMRDCAVLGAGAFVAPMIESRYASEKFIKMAENIFKAEEMNKIKFYLNIETKYGYEHLDEILNAENAKYISGIVVGRTDLTGSLGLNKEDVNSEIIYDYVEAIAKKTYYIGKELIIGGSVCEKSLDFFRKLPTKMLHKFETRKIIFDAQSSLSDENIKYGLLKAIEFEIMWLENKKSYYNILCKNDEQRLEELELRYKNILDGCYA